MILAFIHQKGGVGKSTLSIATSIWLARRGRDVLLVDVDTQGTSYRWGKRFGEKFGVEARAQHQRLLRKDARSLKADHQDLILDLPPTVTPQTEKAIEIADFLIIPMRPSLPDLWALDRLIGLILVSDRKPPPPYRILYSQTTSAPSLEFQQALETRRVEAFEEAIPLNDDWAALFGGENLTDEMDKRLAAVLNALPIAIGAGH